MGGEVITGVSGRSESKFIFFIRRPGKYYVSISHQQRSGGRRPGEAIPRRDASPHRGGAAWLRSWLPGPGVGYLTIGSGWFFDLAGTGDLGVDAQMPNQTSQPSDSLSGYACCLVHRITSATPYPRPPRQILKSLTLFWKNGALRRMLEGFGFLWLLTVSLSFKAQSFNLIFYQFISQRNLLI